MASKQILGNQTIIVHEGIIQQVGNRDEIKVPEAALIIEGNGKYLMPGLFDMHTHITDKNDLILLIANGVTTVRNMADYSGWVRLLGFPNILTLQKEIKNNKLLGPTIYTAGPILEERQTAQPFMQIIKDVSEAEKAVAVQKKKGYDFIKVYDHLTPEVYESIY